MAGVRRTKSSDGSEHPKWRFWYIDYTGKRRWGTGVENKTKTLGMARKLEAEHRDIRVGLRPMPNEATSRNAEDVVDEYLAWGNAQGGRGGRSWGKHHADNRKLHLGWWVRELA